MQHQYQNNYEALLRDIKGNLIEIMFLYKNLNSLLFSKQNWYDGQLIFNMKQVNS